MKLSPFFLFLSIPVLAQEPILYNRIPIPKEFLTTQDGHRFGGDIRICDLNGDSQCDFLVYRSGDKGPGGPAVGGYKPVFLGAFEMNGKAIWQIGGGGTHPVRPGSVAVYDIDGDGAAEVITFFHSPEKGSGAGWDTLEDVVILIIDGKTGQILRKGAPEGITRRRCAPKEGKLSLGRQTANWVHQRILVANFRGKERPQDFIVKLGDTHVAFTDELKVLWTYTTKWVDYSHCPAYIPAVGDIDGDGKDEVNSGYFLLDDNGKPLWEKKLGNHMDSVAIAEWDGGKVRAICSGFGHVMDAGGKALVSLGEEVVPHGQEVRVADFLPKQPGPEMVIRHQGHKPGIIVVGSQDGKVLKELEINACPNNTGMESVAWNGPGKPAWLFNGDRLWDLETAKAMELYGLPPANGAKFHRMGFYHCIPANLCGDEREEVVLWDPTATAVYVFTPAPLNFPVYKGYGHGPRQYNPRIMD